MEGPEDSRRRALFIGPNDGRVPKRRVSPRWLTDLARDIDHGLMTLQAAHSSIDAVVIDERLGVLTGHALLAHIQGLYPRLSCLLLREKPGKPQAGAPAFLPLIIPRGVSDDEFEARLDRTCALQRLISTDGVRSVCGELTWLPPVPRTYWDLVDALSADVGLSSIANIIQSDPALSAKVLQLANRSFFGLAKKTTSIGQAVTLLGANILRGLVLTVHIFNAMEGVEVPGFSLEQFRDYSFACARLAQRFVRTKALADEAFTAALLHDIGKLVLALRRPLEVGEAMAKSLVTRRPLHEVEREIIGVTHAEAGAYVLSAWGLPASILECVAFHHATILVETDDCELVGAVHGADALVRTIWGADPDALDESLLRRAGLLGDVDRWLKLVDAERTAHGR